MPILKHIERFVVDANKNPDSQEKEVQDFLFNDDT